MNEFDLQQKRGDPTDNSVVLLGEKNTWKGEKGKHGGKEAPEKDPLGGRACLDHSVSAFGSSAWTAAAPSPSPDASPEPPASILARDFAKSSSWIRSISSSVMPFPLAFFAFRARSPCAVKMRG